MNKAQRVPSFVAPVVPFLRESFFEESLRKFFKKGVCWYQFVEKHLC
jgi:hypothetical protein